MNSIRHCLSTYTRLLDTHPYKTNALSGVVLCAVGDVITQKFVINKTDQGEGLRAEGRRTEATISNE